VHKDLDNRDIDEILGDVKQRKRGKDLILTPYSPVKIKP